MNLRVMLLVATFALAFAVAVSCTWGSYNGAAGTGDGGADQPCDNLSTVCTGNLLCVSNKCRTSCSAMTGDSACPAGERCLMVSPTSGNGNSGEDGGPVGGAQYVCVDSASMACTPCTSSNTTCSFCPNGSSCAFDGQCRNPNCTMGSASQGSCANGQSCISNPDPTCANCMSGNCALCNAYCFGTPPHDSLVDGGGAATVFAPNQSGVGSIAVDPSWVAWSTNNGADIAWCAPSGCNGKVPPQIGTGGQATGLADFNGQLFWPNGNAVGTCQLPACSSGAIGAFATGSFQVQNVAVSPPGSGNPYVAWAQGNGAINVCPVGTSCTTANPTIATESAQGPPPHIALDGTNVYWSGPNGIRTCPTANCAGGPQTIAGAGTGAQGGSFVAVNNTGVYFTVGNQLYMCPKGGCGGTATLIDSEPGQINDLVVAPNADVFFTTNGTSGSSVVRCGGGCIAANAPLTRYGQAQGGSVQGVAVSASTVYWASQSAVLAEALP